VAVLPVVSSTGDPRKATHAGVRVTNEISRPGDPQSPCSVFSADGELRGVIAMPHGIEVLEIGAD